MKSRLRRGLLISSITFLVLLCALEVTGHIWEKKTAQGQYGWTLVASRRMKQVFKGASDQLYYLYQPDKDYLWEGIPVHTNSRGLRDDEVAIPKPAGTYRILNVGDSIVFGWRVELEETYGKQLQASLNNGIADQPVEVVNAGMPGWSLEASRNFLLQEGLDYQPDAIILSIAVVNDMTSTPVTRPENTIFTWLRDNTYSWPFLTTEARFLLARQVGPEAIPVLNPPQDARSYYPQNENNPIYDQVWQYVLDMRDAAQEKGIPFITIVFPTAFQLNSANHPNVAQRTLMERAEADGVTMIDLLPIYAEACAAVGPDACEGYENALFADVWMHPNPTGHQLAADQLLALWPFEQTGGAK
ncbi:MAG: SGNH/GDSL hydrolase family protein [Candidatus Promineifilaceae bacterium]